MELEYQKGLYGKYFFNFYNHISENRLKEKILNLSNILAIAYLGNLRDIDENDLYDLFLYIQNIEEITCNHIYLMFIVFRFLTLLDIKFEDEKIRNIIDFLITISNQFSDDIYEISISFLFFIAIKCDIIHLLIEIKIFDQIPFFRNVKYSKLIGSCLQCVININKDDYFIDTAILFINIYLDEQQDYINNTIFKLLDIIILLHPENNYHNILNSLFQFISIDLYEKQVIKLLCNIYEEQILIEKYNYIIYENIDTIFYYSHLSRMKKNYIKLFRKYIINATDDLNEEIFSEFIENELEIINIGTYKEKKSFIKLLYLYISPMYFYLIEQNIDDIIYYIETEDAAICNIICEFLLKIIYKNTDFISYFNENYTEYYIILENMRENQDNNINNICNLIDLINSLE